ncbi:spore germination protein GerPC [Schinkia sp. CFF1]
MNGNSIQYYLSQVDSYLRAQHNQLIRLQEEVRTLQEKVNSLRDPQTTHIERIEYKFDQLKIETLEGTLNIGLTPQGMSDPDTFEHFSVNQDFPGSASIFQKYPQLYPQLREGVQQFLRGDCQQFMDECAIKYNITVSGPHRDFIIQDVERQLDERLNFYLNQATKNHVRNGSQEEIIHFVSSEVKRDITNAIDAFIKHMPMGGNFT